MKHVWLTKNERVNTKHKCIRWKLVKKSLERLVLCSLGLIRSARYTCSCLTIILLFLLCSLIFSSPFYKGLSALYSLPGYISAFHLEGLGLFPLILVPSGLHWKAFTPGYELWWHCLEVISLLMWPTKSVQRIECRGDWCFIYTLPFFACPQIFLLLLSLCPMVFRTSPRPFRGHKSILKVLEHYSLPRLVMYCLYFLEGVLWVPSEVCFSHIGLLSFDPVLRFSSSPISYRNLQNRYFISSIIFYI